MLCSAYAVRLDKVDHVFAPLPVRQWVLALPKRLRSFVRRGLIDRDDATAMRASPHDGGFSVDGSVRIEGPDRTGLEGLLRTCARPPFALERPQGSAGRARPLGSRKFGRGPSFP